MGRSSANKKANEESRAQKKKRREENRRIQENLYWVAPLFVSIFLVVVGLIIFYASLPSSSVPLQR